MFCADDAEMLRGDRLTVPLHRSEQLGDARAVDPFFAEELGERLMRAADLFEHLALDGSPGKTTKLGNEFPHRAMALEIAISGNVGREITLHPCLVVPVRAGRIPRSPLLPIRI